MGLLNQIVNYWYDCVKNEDILGKDVSINVKKKAALYPFDEDHFLFNAEDTPIEVTNKDLIEFYEYATTEGEDVFYGYPLLFYKEKDKNKSMVAPLFIIKVSFYKKGESLFLGKEEITPSCGIQAFTKLGLKIEELANLTPEIEKAFGGLAPSNRKEIAAECIKIIAKEASVQEQEPINPSNLSNSTVLTKTSPVGLYNKSMLFTGEKTVYNIKLLEDLLELKSKSDIEKTALSYLLGREPSDRQFDIKPILPFPANEYQIKAMQDIFKNRLSVITGPPGTGKSQFIANLLINLFIHGKSVLFVSHTNEAVDVVNEKINEQFINLMLRTGRKQFRQELKGKFNEILNESRRTYQRRVKVDYIYKLWDKAIQYRNELLKIDALEQEYERLFFPLEKRQRELFNKYGIFSRFFSYLQRIINEYRLFTIRLKLNSLPSKSEVEVEIRKMEAELYDLSRQYVKEIYIGQMIGKGKDIGRVKSFLSQVESARYGDDSIEPGIFGQALDILKVWSCTLKSLRNTFPLKPNVFDYVIFDEASQVDLPSAAPALYRAKNAIVVGDPMQLCHIAGITKDTDKSLAKTNGVYDKKDVYPYKIRYYDISLYRSAENSLTNKPILLTNHYRSEDEIIALCNSSFYDGQLKIMTTLDYARYPKTLPIGIQWVDCKGEVVRNPTGSRVNTIEAHKVKDILKDVLDKIAGTNLSIGIVTPYSRQGDEITRVIIESIPNYMDLKEKHKIEVLTAHKFQGSEKDIMIFSLVLATRSSNNANRDRWFNIYPQILNVALSRAKYLLYIVGDKQFCLEHSCEKNEECILKRIVKTYDELKIQGQAESYVLGEKVDSPTERLFLDKLLQIDFNQYGYKLIPKYVCKRYTLDFALVGLKKIDIECDGSQHEIIKGLPVLEDIERDAFLKKEGWEVLRFPNHKILSNPENSINKILAALKA